MSLLLELLRKTPESLRIYWMLARIMVPIMVGAEVLLRLGVIEHIAPLFEPLMSAVGLPAELGLAWLTAIVVGLWGAVPLLFTLVPVSSLTVGEVSIFSALLLFAHGLPLEQKIIQTVGPGFWFTTFLRVAGGLLYAFLLHHTLQFTGWLSAPVDPTWIPMSATPSWPEFFISLTEAMVWMLVILVGLFWALELFKAFGIMNLLMKALLPVLRLAGIQKEAGHLTLVGLFLGISFGAGVLIREARSRTVSPRQIFLSCVLMGFAHSIVEDTLLMMALGADVFAILLGRVVFAIVATGLIALVLQKLSDAQFHAYFFRASAV